MDTEPPQEQDVAVTKDLPNDYNKITDLEEDIPTEPSITFESEAQFFQSDVTFDGRGRQRSDEEVNEILDLYVEVGDEALDGLSTRMRHYYRHHKRLEERKELYAGRTSREDKVTGVSNLVHLSVYREHKADGA